MANSKNRGDSKASLEAILAEFGRRESTLSSFCARTKGLIEASLQDANIRYQSVQARVKTKAKLEKKYLDPTKNYTQLDDITDLAGLRVITYYEDELDLVAQVLEREFNIDRKDSVDKRNTEPDRFGYRAINYVCCHLDKRIMDVEYKQFAGVKCEIQITSILGHAWSEIEHEWYDLREAYPDEVKRRFSIIAALFELAGREFVDIRKSKTQYERAIALQVEANVPDTPLDAVSLRTFIDQEPLVGEIDGAVASALGFSLTAPLTDGVLESRARAANLVGITKLQDLRTALGVLGEVIPEFMERCIDEVWPNDPQSSRAEPGVCIYHLALLTAATRGEKGLSAFFTSITADYTDKELKRITTIAQETLAKRRK